MGIPCKSEMVEINLQAEESWWQNSNSTSKEQKNKTKPRCKLKKTVLNQELGSRLAMMKKSIIILGQL